MRALADLLKEAERNKTAIGHFNFAELTVFKATIAAAGDLNVPVILGTSEKEREFLGVELIKNLISGYRISGGISDIQIFFNADHTKSLEKVKEAAEAGYDAVLFDGSELPLEENIRQTKEVVEWVKSKNPNIVVEGEIGYIGGSSKLLEAVPEGVEMTSVADAVRFVKETGVDLLAPAVGNIHGMLTTAPEPKLDIERIKAIKEALRQAQGKLIPLVLHGASGNTDEDIKAAVKAGISIVHINTEIRAAWRGALEKSLQENPKEIAPYNLLQPAEKAAYEVIFKKLKVFNNQ